VAPKKEKWEMSYLLLAVVVLTIIVVTSLAVEDLKKKALIFLGLGAVTYGGLWKFGGNVGHEVLHHVFLVDYPQFIPIPIATVLIASLALFTVKASPKARIGWFALLVCPIVGNFGTTWALVPIGLSIMPILKKLYPDRWFRILIAICIFSMNMLALGTLAADPPQALWAVKVSVSGEPLGFFFPFTQFWPYIMITWVVYFVTLKRFGVAFGSLKQLLNISPENWWKAAYGVVVAACVGFSITFLRGYEVTVVLGSVCVFVACSSIFFGHEVRHNTLHWVTETMTIFIAFFSVVALAHVGLHSIHIPNQGMIGVVVGLTLGADNAAAFAAAYPQFEPLDQAYMVWYNLHPSVTYGGLSPLGNGPQIALFLIVLVSLKVTNAKTVFITWFKEAAAFGPYLLTWTLCISTLIEFDFRPTIAIQLLTGLAASVACFQFMDMQRLFRAHIDNTNGHS